MKKLCLGVFLVGLLFISGCGVTTNDAEHTGYITAVEKNGLIWKTGKIYIKSELSSSQEESYCVTDEGVYKQLKEKAVNKERVTLVYHSEIIVAPWRCGEENAIVDTVK